MSARSLAAALVAVAALLAVRRTITVDLRNIDRFDQVLTDAVDAGANHVHGVQFRTTELRKHRDQARSIAIQAARDKAIALAQSLGRKVGAVTTIREDGFGWWSSYGSWWGGRHGAMSQNVVQSSAAAPADPDAVTAPGQISVTARVTVTFALE
ncbi:MAG: SIMPL domain-containing protein [Candidatus Rokubacteria bacterium]|nr:SIMPL domain-containing protein [Candidatus Rokubacteria bacterium]